MLAATSVQTLTKFAASKPRGGASTRSAHTKTGSWGQNPSGANPQYKYVSLYVIVPQVVDPIENLHFFPKVSLLLPNTIDLEYSELHQHQHTLLLASLMVILVIKLIQEVEVEATKDQITHPLLDQCYQLLRTVIEL